MAVIRSQEALWKHKIFYAMSGSQPVPQIIQEAIDALTEQLGFALFVPLPHSDTPLAHAVFVLGAAKSCSPIGQQATQPQEISLKGNSPRRTILHEMLHCAGFEHEQFHENFPWDRSDLPDVAALNENDLSEDKLSKVKKPFDESKDHLEQFKARATQGKLSLELGDKPKNLSNLVGDKLSNPTNKSIYDQLALRNSREYVNAYLRDLKLKQNTVVSLGALCDFESIMMYPEFIAAVKAAKKQVNDNKLPSISPLTDGKSQKLSDTDVKFIKELYEQRCKG